MHRHLLKVSLFLLCFSNSAAIAQAWPEQCTVEADLLNVRAAPGTGNPILTQLGRGHVVVWWSSEYDADGDIWHRFPLGNGEHGFAAAKNMSCNFELTAAQIDPHRTIALHSDISEGYADLLQRKLSQIDGIPIVFLSSAGGLIDEAMAAGRYLRAANATVIVNSYCASACLYVFAGGKFRVTNMSARLGLHRAFLPTRDLTTAERLEVLVKSRRYLEEMGVNPLFADVADAYKGDPIWLTEAQLFELGLITDMVFE